MLLLCQPKYWAISSGEQPNRLRVLESPTLKLWVVSPSQSWASERWTRKQCLTAEPRNGHSPTDRQSETRKKYARIRRPPELGMHEHNSPAKAPGKHLGLKKGQGKTHGGVPLRTVFARDSLTKKPPDPLA